MLSFVGVWLVLSVVELTHGVPATNVQYERYEIRYIYRPYPNHYYYDRHLDTFNNQRPQNNSGGHNRSSGESRPNTQTQTFNHTPQQRTESWGTKNWIRNLEIYMRGF